SQPTNGLRCNLCVWVARCNVIRKFPGHISTSRAAQFSRSSCSGHFGSVNQTCTDGLPGRVCRRHQRRRTAGQLATKADGTANRDDSLTSAASEGLRISLEIRTWSRAFINLAPPKSVKAITDHSRAEHRLVTYRDTDSIKAHVNQIDRSAERINDSLI